MAGSNVRRVLEMARELSSDERAALVGELLVELDYPGPPSTPEESDAAWRSEWRVRAARVLRGESKGVDAAQVHAELDEELSKA